MNARPASPACIEDHCDADLWNEDLAPTSASQRRWTYRSYCALWVGMVACVPTYMLASGLIASGLSAGQAIVLVFLGNGIVLIPMLLVGAAGARYGIPFPVLVRASFGPRGAQIAALARALVACGWFGINTWVGGTAVYALINILSQNAAAGPTLAWLGINTGQLCSFLAFWLVHLVFIRRGTESIRWLEIVSAPLLTVMALILLGWAYAHAHGFGPMLSARSAFRVGSGRELQFWPTIVASLTAMVGFWATLALNICDFTRFSRSQRDQVIGQILGLPVPMAFFSFIGVAVTSATVVIFGRPIWEPTELAARLGGAGAVIALTLILLCTLTVNMAANVVSPSYDFSNLAPSRISFVTGGYITAAVGVLMMPWKLMSSAGTYINLWLVGYSALLGPIAGIMICDYYFVRRRRLTPADLYRHHGIYSGTLGWNPNAVVAMLAGLLPNIPGFLHSVDIISAVPVFCDQLFGGAWFIGFLVGGIVYGGLTARKDMAS